MNLAPVACRVAAEASQAVQVTGHKHLAIEERPSRDGKWASSATRSAPMLTEQPSCDPGCDTAVTAVMAVTTIGGGKGEKEELEVRLAAVTAAACQLADEVKLLAQQLAGLTKQQ